MKRSIAALAAAAVALAGCGGAGARSAASPSPSAAATSTAPVATVPSCTPAFTTMLESIVTGLHRQERLIRRTELPAHTALSIGAGAWGGLGIYRARLARFIDAEASVTANEGGIGHDVAQAVSDGRALLKDASTGHYAGGHLKAFRIDIAFLASPRDCGLLPANAAVRLALGRG